MLRYATIIAPLLMRKGTPNPVRVLTGYMGALFLTVIAGVFFLAALFTWIATNYGLDVAFLCIALILTAGAIGLTIMARVSQTVALKKAEDRHARIKGMLAAKEDPLSEHIPEEVLTHPISQKILAQVEDRPFVAGATAVGLGIMLSRQLLDATD
ncbi:MAG: hypothetical protein AAF311_08365 [Pseudomonadota bacterium]